MGSWDYFVAHAGADAAVAVKLADLLKARGAQVFVDADLRPGDVWPRVLADAQENSAITVVLVSNLSDAAYYELEEIVAGIAQSRLPDSSHRVVPVLLEEGSRVPYGLKGRHALKALDAPGLERAAADLLGLLSEAVNERAGKLWSPLIPSKSRFFAGRDDLLARLTDRSAVLTQSIAGLGGVGKTTVAAALCWAQEDTIDIVWRVRAETETTLIQDLSDLGAELGLPSGDDLAERACRALERDTRRWLLVFDNADSEDLVHRFTPRRGHGQVVVTTRRQDFTRRQGSGGSSGR